MGTRKNAPLEIPAECTAIKDWFPTEASARAVLDEIRGWLRAGNMPHLWRGHTHTAPKRDGRIVYLGEFELPKGAASVRRLAPCPCCTPQDPKFGCGLIAWFPEEHTLRMVGSQCFAALDPDGHQNAIQKMRQEENHRREVEYLLKNRDNISKSIEILRSALEIAIEVDRMHTGVHKVLTESRIDLWRHLSRGVLYIDVAESVSYQTGSGIAGEKESMSAVPYASGLQGYQFYNRNSAPCADRLKQAITDFKQIGVEQPNWEIRVQKGSAVERSLLARRLSRASTNAIEGIRYLEDMRKGVATFTTATIRNWLLQEGAPDVRLYIRTTQGHILVGLTEQSATQIKSAPALFSAVRPLPIAKTAI